MRINQIKETCLYVKDLEKTKTFYAGKMGLEIIHKAANRHIFFRAGSSVLLCFLPEVTSEEKELPPHAAHGQIHIAFEVPADDYEANKHDIQERGIDIIHEQLWHAGKKSFYFRDPDGHLLEVVPQGLWD